MKKIMKGYETVDGSFYPDLRVIKYDSLEELEKEKTKTIIRTGDYKSPSKDNTDSNGISINQLVDEPNKAYRLINGLEYYHYFLDNTELSLLEYLQKRQENIKLTDFPTAAIMIQDQYILGLDHYVGQEIPYYEDYFTLEKFFKQYDLSKSDRVEVLFTIFKQITSILEELMDNNIYYTDIHKNNFLINLNSLNVKLIDFESRYILRTKYEEYIVLRMKWLIKELAILSMVSIDDVSLYYPESFWDIEDYIDDEYKRLRKK